MKILDSILSVIELTHYVIAVDSQLGTPNQIMFFCSSVGRSKPVRNCNCMICKLLTVYVMSCSLTVGFIFSVCIYFLSFLILLLPRNGE